jgi:hypothetical protein
VQVATAEWDVQKPKVIIAKKELTAVLLSFDPFRNVRVSAEHAAINGLTGRESNVDIRHLDTNQVGNGVLVGRGRVRWGGGSFGWVGKSTSFHPFLQRACVQMFNDDIYVTLLLRHFFIKLQDAHLQRFISESVRIRFQIPDSGIQIFN